MQDIREVVEQKLAQMLARNPQRMDYYKRYQEIVADYNREKDRITIEETFAKLLDLMKTLDEEQQRAAKEGLTEEQLAVFDLLQSENLSRADRERVKLASKNLFESLQKQIASMERWTEKEQTQAEVKVFILDRLYQDLPMPPFTNPEISAAADKVYRYAWQQAVGGYFAAL